MQHNNPYDEYEEDPYSHGHKQSPPRHNYNQYGQHQINYANKNNPQSTNKPKRRATHSEANAANPQSHQNKQRRPGPPTHASQAQAQAASHNQQSRRRKQTNPHPPNAQKRSKSRSPNPNSPKSQQKHQKYSIQYDEHGHAINARPQSAQRPRKRSQQRRTQRRGKSPIRNPNPNNNSNNEHMNAPQSKTHRSSVPTIPANSNSNPSRARKTRQSYTINATEHHNPEQNSHSNATERTRTPQRRRRRGTHHQQSNSTNNNDHHRRPEHQNGGDEHHTNQAKNRRNTTTVTTGHANQRKKTRSKSRQPRRDGSGSTHSGHSGHSGDARRSARARTPNPKKRESQRKLTAEQSQARLNKGKLAETYLIKEKLGKGNFAVVRRVVRKQDEREFAAKIISKKTLSQQEIEELNNEVRVLGQLRHPNIVCLVDYIATPRHLYIVLELLTGGELFDRIIAKGKFSEQQAANIAKQLADALAYIHEKGIVHRDLKPENILYESNMDDARIKITDFGLSRDTENHKKSLKTACGTPGYVAPEILKAQIYDESVDLWSVGVIIYILLCGFPPFQGAGPDHTNQMFRKIKAGLYSFPSPAWDNVSLVAKDCIQGLLTVNPKDRMNATELRIHPWVKHADLHSGKELLNMEFQQNLCNYLHKKRLRRGVRLIITLNRMLRAAGLEASAREQRRLFRIRLRQYKKKVKAQQKMMFEQKKLAEMNGYEDDEFGGYTILDPDETPAIDYSKV